MASSGSAYKLQVAERRRRQLLQHITAATALPTSPVVPMRVLELQRTPGATLADFAEALAADAGLAVKLLAIANAHAHNAPTASSGPIVRLSEAVNLIGLDNLPPLVCGLSLAGIFHKLALPPQERLATWRAAMLKGLVAREFALAYAPELEEEAFVFATLQDVALTVMHSADRAAWPETQAILALEDEADRRERERQLNGIDHAELGARLLHQVGAPAPLVAATAAHHQGLAELERAVGDRLAAPLYLASLVPHKAAPLVGSAANRIAQVFSAAHGIERIDACDLLHAVTPKYTRALTDFGDGEEASAAFKDFLHSMCAQVAVSVESAVRVSTDTITDLRIREANLQGAVSQLQQKVLQSDFDPLTKALNRRGFTERATRLLEGGNRKRAWAAVGFVDMDNFKRLNDDFGHSTGDAALINVSARLRDAVQGKGIVGRVGGDEFCFMLVSQGSEFDEREADRLKIAMSGLSVEFNGETVTFTTSVGLLSLGTPPYAGDLSTAMARADELMYGAKKNGKNRCVVGRIGDAAPTPMLAAG